MRLRATAALVFAAIAFAVALSVSPQLHAQLHKDSGSAKHECAATLISSGNVEHSACEPPAVAPDKIPGTPMLRAQHSARILASLEFTRLEHAPPALS